jgi:predicted transcriptional regulator
MRWMIMRDHMIYSRVSKETYEKLRRFARKYDYSISELIRRAVIDYMNKMEKQKDEEN